jgi:ribonucleoside-diphosphate reductase alpha chain
VQAPILSGAVRKELPRVRNSKTFSFTVADLHGYFIVGEYEDGRPGELFVSVAKVGSTLSGLMDSFARSVSYGLQHGVPLKVYVKGMIRTAFAPAGITDDADIRTASSLIDYIFKRIAMSYLSFDDRLELGLADIEDMPTEQISLDDVVSTTTDVATVQIENTKIASTQVPSQQSFEMPVEKVAKQPSSSEHAPMCYNCGNQTQRSGSCYVCTSCGSTTGCS